MCSSSIIGELRSRFQRRHASASGYSISVEKIVDYGNFIKASIVIKKPGSNCVVTQARTSPYQFVEVESVKELLFEERVEVVNCM
jgi:hypothetical protein